MSMLAPLFLLGTLLVVGPIAAHLIRRMARDRVVFSSTRWFEPSAPRLSRRNRIEHPWLLALRCLVVLVLAAGFSRPFFVREQPPAPGAATPRHVALILDESASMQRRGLWDAAAERVGWLARDLGPGDRLVAIAAGARTQLILSAATWSATPPGERTALLRSLVTDRSPGAGPARMDDALAIAVDELQAMNDAGAPAEGRIIIVSDLVAGTRVVGLAGQEWPRETTVELEKLEPASSEPNASIRLLGWSRTNDDRPVARVQVTGDGETALTLRLLARDIRSGRELAEARMLALAPHESRTVPVELPAGTVDPLRLEIAGDTESFDNIAWAVPPQPRILIVDYLGGHSADDPRRPLFYVTRAIAGWRDPAAQVRSPPAGEIPDTPAPLTIVAEPLTAAAVAVLRARLEHGAHAIVLVRDPAMAETAAALAGEPGWSTAAPTRRDALLADIDFQHPLFAPFADPRFSDFARVRFWQPVPLLPPAGGAAAVVARFEDGGAAVLEVAVGGGRVILWGGDWTPEAGQWVLSSKFVPWLQLLAERATGGPPRPQSTEVGEAERLAGSIDAGWRPVRRSPGAETLKNDPPVAPGVYELHENGGVRLVALQVPAVESELQPLSLDIWEELGVPLAGRASAAMVAASRPPPATAARPEVLEHDQQLWRWLFIVAAVLLAAESAAAISTARRATLGSS